MAASLPYQEKKLGDIANLRNGKALSTERYSIYGKHPVFGSNGKIAHTDELLNPFPVIVIGRVGAYCGSVFRINEPSWVSDNAIIAEPKDENDLGFLYYILKHLDLNRTAIGSAQPLLTQSGLNILPVFAPPLPEQKAIAHILGALDDKIELNRRMNRTLEAMARAVFKSWFVDLDPVRAKMEGRKPQGMDAATAALFPNRLVDSELGEAPEGWEVKRVADIGSVICGKTPSTQVSEYYGHDVPFITIPDMHGKIFATNTQRGLSYSGAASQQKKMLPSGAICVSCIATPGLVVIASEKSQTNQQINSVIPNGSDENYFWFWVFRGLGEEIRAEGSGGSVLSNLSTGRFAEIQVLAPPERLRTSYQVSSAPFFSKILENEKESRTLAALRDALLPRLLSGEVRVKGKQ